MNNVSYNNTYLLSGLFIGIIIVIIMSCIAIVLIVLNSNNLGDANGTIVGANCNQYVDNNNKIFYNCSLDIEYNVNGQIYKGRINEQSMSPYQIGSRYDLSYEINNPANIQKQVFRYNWIILSLCSCAVILFAITIGSYLLIPNTKTITNYGNKLLNKK